MAIVTAGKICEVVGGKWVSGPSDVKVKGIICKSISVRPGFLYFDVTGGKGGDKNILRALKHGAVAVVISKHKKSLPFANKDIAVFSVAKVWDAFWTTVKFYRDMCNIPVIGVTGTSGKTTTKEMITSIFRTRWRVLKTAGNLNLPHYVPSHIMRMKNGYQAAVFEIGMNRPGQISKQAKIIQPKVGIITHIGTGHIEYLGSYENVIKEKAGIIVGIPKDGYLILNADDPATKKIDVSHFKGKIIYYGIKNKANYMADHIEFTDRGTNFTAIMDGNRHKFFIPIFGKHNVYNALAAIAASRIFNFDIKSIRNGLKQYRKPYMRLQMMKGIRNTTIINDTYNANPDSMIAGLEVLSTLAKGKTSVAVLGNMLEQGEFAAKNHRLVGEKAAELGINWLVTVGRLAREIAIGASAKSTVIKTWSFRWKKDAIAFLRSNLPSGAVVLVKGSRGSYMEQIVKGIKVQIIHEIKEQTTHEIKEQTTHEIKEVK